MSVDLSKIKPGDEVLVRAIVYQTRDENWGLHFKHITGQHDGSVRHYVHPDCIVSHTPKALAVGDRVRGGFGSGMDGSPGVIRNACDGYFWVKFDADEVPRTLTTRYLERVDA